MRCVGGPLPAPPGGGERRAVVRHAGRELVDITDRLPEDAEPEGLRCGDYIHFAPADGAVAVMADAWLDGEDLPPTVCYAVDVQAEITCRDGVFTVQAFHLNVLKD